MKIIINKFGELMFYPYLCIRIKGITITPAIMNTMKLGQYFYGRHRRLFGVWVCDWANEDGTGYSGRFIDDFRTREEAREYVWKMNGWGIPKTALN